MNIGKILHSDKTSVDLALYIALEMKKNDFPKYNFNLNSIK
jgi:hypothetical protein